MGAQSDFGSALASPRTLTLAGETRAVVPRLTEVDIPATPAEVVREFEADSIHIARLTPQPTASSTPPEITKPPAVMFVTDQPHHAYRNPRAALVLIVAVMMMGFLWVLIGFGAAGSSGGSRKAAVHLTAAEQRTAAAARARAAAIAKAKRDRGTDAQWGDTIPALTPAPTSATNVALPATGPPTTAATASSR